MLTRRKFMKTTALVGAGVCLGGFSPKLSRALASPKRVIIGQGGDLPNLDPYGHSAMFNYSQWKHMNEELVRFDPMSRRYIGVLADSWKNEGTEWTFNLRKGINFHDGSDFTARDVVFSFERIIKSKSRQASHFRTIKDMKVVDDFTLKVITNEPFVALLNRVKDFVMVSQQVYKKYGEQEAIRHPTGTGPFKFVEWVRGNHLVVNRNEKYWRKPAQLDQVIWKPIAEDAARIAALEAGEVNIATNLPPHEVDRLEKKPGIRIEGIRSNRSIHIGLPFRFKPFQSRLVRQAMNYGVDIDSIIKHVLDGKAYRATGLAGPSVVGHNPDIKPFPYDPAKAKSLLAQAGYPNGFEVDLYTSTGRYVKDREASEAIGWQLAKVGIRANVLAREWSVLRSGILKGEWPMFLFGGFNLEDLDLQLSSYIEPGITKRLEYVNPQVEKAIKEQRKVFDPVKREKLLRELMKMIYEDAPTIPLWHPQDIYGVTDNVVWKPSPDEDISMYGASVKS